MEVAPGQPAPPLSGPHGKTISLHPGWTSLVTAFPLVSHSLPVQSKAPSSMLFVHKCHVQTSCSRSFSVYTHLHAYVYMHAQPSTWACMLWKTIYISLWHEMQQWKAQTQQCDSVYNGEEKGRWFSTGISFQVLHEICTKIWFIMG